MVDYARVSEWIPDFNPHEWGFTVTFYLDGVIDEMLDILEREYTLHGEGHFDDPSDWKPKNINLRINFPTRVSSEAIKKLKKFDADIKEFRDI